jgi:DNA (cytosine-5)-methyltransferase 1
LESELKPTTVSLFCGAGGESAGKELAFRELGIKTTDWASLAINHWDLAVATHGANFPRIHVEQEDITKVTAATYGVKHIDMLWASPSCVHHSRARGGKPCDDQQRSHADEVVDRWLKVADVDVLLIENVPEFAEWGPLDAKGKPIKARKGEYFHRFLGKLKGLGYRFDYRALVAANYGDPTTRKRFFLQAERDGFGIAWPEPTHRDPKKPGDMFTGHLPTWRTAAECIDWSIPCRSIFDRKKPLADATLRRIAAGVVRYILDAKRPFLLNLSHGGRLESLDDPMNTLTAEPKGGDRALVAASMVSLHGTSPAHLKGCTRDIREPLPAIAASGGHAALVAALLVQSGYGERVGQAPRTLDIEMPLGTVVAGGIKHGLVAATLMTNTTGHAPTDLDAPIPTITTGNHQALVAAFLTKYHATGGQWQSVADPLHAVTTKDEFGLVTVEIDGETFVITDIFLRMLKPKELAKAMGFPDGFRFVGKGGKRLSLANQVKMIGNACPVHTVAELIKTVVRNRPATFGQCEPIQVSA